MSAVVEELKIMREPKAGESRLRWIRTSKSRPHSIYSPGGAEWPDFYITLQEFTFGEWVDVPILEAS